jgi:hypothetical protein
MESHFKYALGYFAKFDRHTKERSALHPYEEESLYLQAIKDAEDETAFEKDLCLLPPKKEFEQLVPQIILELKRDTLEKLNLVEVKKQNYTKVFVMIHLGILKYTIDAFVNKNIGGTKYLNATIGYILNVDALLFQKVLNGSYITMKELVIASGFASDELDFKKNVRVITEREEQLLPILQQKSSTVLPLKSFYVHARLYERYIHLSLNQVVIEGQVPDTNAKNIVIKSKIITLGYLFDLICDNLWVVANFKDYMISNANCKKHKEDHNHPQEFSNE